MTSIIKFTALSGAKTESPPCYLLQVDDFCFLLDCGWDERFNTTVIENIKRCVRWNCNSTTRGGSRDVHSYFENCIKTLFFRHIHQIDAILLSHPDVVHLGALPYIVGKLGLKCPAYATVPVYKMGQMFMYDLYQVNEVFHFDM